MKKTKEAYSLTRKFESERGLFSRSSVFMINHTTS